MKKNIYVIDDEKDIQDILRINLSNSSYDVTTYSSAEEAYTSLEKGSIPDIIILDIMMDGMDGYDFCKFLRASDTYKHIPIIFLSAKSEEFDKVLGLELGGDDFITKPFSLKELQSRVKAVLRRAKNSKQVMNEGESRKKITYKSLALYPENYSLLIENKNIKLTKTEFEMLHLFLSHPDKIFSRDNIIDSIRGHDVYVIDRTIDVHIMNLRKKLGKYKNIVTTFSGVGYGFKKDAEE